MQNLIVVLFLLLFRAVHATCDLEEWTQNFVLENKQIKIPGHPHAFNPSIVSWQNRLLLSFREIKDRQDISILSSMSHSKIGLVWVDEDFNPLCAPQLLDLGREMQSEDARLLAIKDRLYLIYSGNSDKIIDDEGFRVYVAEIDFDGERFFVVHNECMSHFDGSKKNKREKNWVPFEYEGELFLSYSLVPHKVFKPRLDHSKICDLVVQPLPSIAWEWGELRGGTPALAINDEYYLAFFHSSIRMASIHSENIEMPHYFIGAYLFARSHPFEIKQVSPEPITGPLFYCGLRYEPYWHPVQVVFPCGYIVDENNIWLTYGRQDHEMWVVKLDKQTFLESFINVSTVKGKNG
ncbi:MAG: hypothetical protein ACSNEK_10195 [Parachlamydiaceae bacterium]